MLEQEDAISTYKEIDYIGDIFSDFKKQHTFHMRFLHLTQYNVY